MSPCIRKAHFLSDFLIIDQKVLFIFFKLEGQALLINGRKTQLLNWVCDRYGCGMGFGRGNIFSQN